MIHGLQSAALEDAEADGVGQRQGGHEAAQEEQVEAEEGCEAEGGVAYCVEPQRGHDAGAAEVADAEEPHGVHPAVGDVAHGGGHEQRHESHGGVEPGYVAAKTHAAQQLTQAREVTPPDAELQEIERR